jgi:hypothetical protein
MTTNSLSQVPRELASNWVYKVHAWRGKSPEFMQAQVSRLEAVIREAMQLAQPQWISVKDKLPTVGNGGDFRFIVSYPESFGRNNEPTGKIIVTFAGYGPCLNENAKDDPKGWRWERHFYELGGLVPSCCWLDSVTHWMPLPEPPNPVASSLTEQETTK